MKKEQSTKQKAMNELAKFGSLKQTEKELDYHYLTGQNFILRVNNEYQFSKDVLYIVRCNNEELYISKPNLPKYLIIEKGSLNAVGVGLTKLPEILRVDGSLLINNNRITSLPLILWVNGEFNCSNNKITSIPYTIDISLLNDFSNNEITSCYTHLECCCNLNHNPINDYKENEKNN